MTRQTVLAVYLLKLSKCIAQTAKDCARKIIYNTDI